ncbi:hypothetical protein Tco_0859891 [Tanacetum coccineum]|uniref:Uncharacterized protein n=1 Tax=Tanacetum coccineum TaxID=301880 RepID=A0ABQ5BIZ6_9ASTR
MNHRSSGRWNSSSTKLVYFGNTITILKKEDEPRELETSKLSEIGHDGSNLAKDLSDESIKPKEITNDVGLSNLRGKECKDGIEKNNEWIKYKEPLDLVNLYDESIYESITGEMPRCLLIYDFRIEKGDPNNLKFPCMIGNKFIPNAYIDIDLPMNITSLAYYNDIRRKGFEYKGENFVGIGKDMHVFIGNMSHIMDFIILKSIEANMDPSLSQDPKRSELTSEGHDLFSSRIILSEDDYDRGCERPSDLESGFYKDVNKLGPEYRTRPDGSSSRSDVNNQGGSHSFGWVINFFVVFAMDIGACDGGAMELGTSSWGVLLALVGIEMVCLDRLCRLAILCLDQHAYTLYHLESLLTISLDRLDILKKDLVYQSLRKFLSLNLKLS